MKPEELVEKAKRMIGESIPAISLFTQAQEFFRVHAGEKSSFYLEINKINPKIGSGFLRNHVEEILKGFIYYVEA